MLWHVLGLGHVTNDVVEIIGIPHLCFGIPNDDVFVVVVFFVYWNLLVDVRYAPMSWLSL